VSRAQEIQSSSPTEDKEEDDDIIEEAVPPKVKILLLSTVMRSIYESGVIKVIALKPWSIDYELIFLTCQKLNLRGF
jgi:hypothetical protein